MSNEKYKFKTVIGAGQKIGSWIIMGRAVPDKKGNVTWLCKCSCGRIGMVRQYSLGKSSSRCTYCGRRMTPKLHGLKNHSLYNIWCNMKQRCNNPNYRGYKYWGERGITVCDEWRQNFVAFYQWTIENGWKANLTLDRINNDDNYCPGNCRFVTYTRQARNQRHGRFATIDGRTKHIFDWAEEYGMPILTISDRYARGWRGPKLLIPIETKKRNHLYGKRKNG